jgi:serine/threonine protein kinase
MSDFEALSSGLRSGDILAGKYRVERVLGAGGMGVVVAAHHIQLDERVALKFLLPSALNNVDAVERFTREARAAAKIKSEHVARVTDVGTLENGAVYMVMEYLEGSDLSAWLTENGPAPIEQAVSFVLQTCEALAEAHALGIVHRDLKPANLFLANRPSSPPIVKVLDFGISKSAFSTSQPQLTKTSTVMGSPLYMSPEQMQSSKTVDVRSDIWALGVVLYELISGKAPFQGDTMPELVVAVLQLAQEPLHSMRPDVPPELEAVLARCLEKTPAARFANVGALASALAPFGPPRSEVSVERILHVLGGLSLPPARVSSPVAVITQPGHLDVSPNASTLADSAEAWLEKKASPASSLPVPRGLGAATTSKPVSSDGFGLAQGRAGKKSRVGLVAGLLVILGAGGWFAWQAKRGATEARESSPPTGHATASPGPEPNVTPSASAASTAVPISPPPTDRAGAEPSPATSSSGSVAPPKPASTKRATTSSPSVPKASASPTSTPADPFGPNRR